LAAQGSQGAGQYAEAIELVIELCKQHFKNRLSSIVLYGSVALGDHVPQYSDLDLMFIIEGHMRHPLDHEALHSIKLKVRRATGIDVHELWVFGKSLLLSVPVFWERLGAKTIYGESIIDKAPPMEFSKTTSIKMMNAVRWRWKNNLGSLTLEEKAKNALNSTLKLAQSALLYYDHVAAKKCEIAEGFEAIFNGSHIGSAPRIAYEHIQRWDELRDNNSALVQIINEYDNFSDSLFWFIGLRTLFESTQQHQAT
jgi:predicted nucleotidyltransferase